MNARYLPLLRLASGKDADVYLGVLRSVQGYGRPVVMKRAFAGLRGDEAKARERLVEEADAALRLRHPHVVGALELAELPEGLVLVYDYVGGLSLYGLVRHLARDRATVPDAYVCQIVADAAAGLAYSHRVLGRGHGDLSSRNVLISDEAFGRVIDFAPAHDRLTPHYASPERARGGPPTEASDVYSLGLLAYLLRTGAPAFNAPTSKATLEAIATGPSPELPAGPLADVTRAMLARNPAGRPTLEEASERLLMAASGGASRPAFRRWLRAEAGVLLDARRKRVARIVEGHEREHRNHGDTRTMAAFEALFEAEGVPELDGTRVER